MSSTKDPLETMIDELIHRDQAMLKGLFPDSASTDTDLVIWMSGASFAPGCPNESSHTSRRNFSLDQIQREGLVAILRDTLQNGLDELGFIET
jgi:hypothetical protein